MDSAKAEKLVKAARWYHSFEVLPGIWTPGVHRTDSARLLNSRFNMPEDLTGKTVLDIGALDGPHSFELERRGANVTSLDIQSPDVSGYGTAHKVRGSKNTYIQGSVYNLDDLLKGMSFDIILFFGVWYHLKNPVLAFEQIAGVMTKDSLLCFEGEVLKNYAEKHDETEHPDSELISRMADSDLPVTLYYSGRYKKSLYNWFVPNRACVNEWIETAGLQMTSHGFWDKHPNQRLYGTAKKRASGRILVDNPVFTRD
jgi:tRNA (mo5U34)-methyltransferase